MINIPENVTLEFDENGKSLTEVLEQLLTILLNKAEEGEAECIRKK